MNLTIYCKAITVVNSVNDEMEVSLSNIDKLSLMEVITDNFSLLELTKMYDEVFEDER